MILSRKKKRDFHLLVFTGFRYRLTREEVKEGSIEGHRQTGSDSKQGKPNEMRSQAG